MSRSRSDAAVSRDAMELAKASYERCNGHEAFFETFYRNFFKNCPEAEPLFARTDFERQHNLLRHAIGLLLIFPSQRDAEPNILTRLAERHSRRDLNVSPEWYPAFADSLVETVAAFDPAFSSEIESAWRNTVAHGIAYLQSKY